MKTRYLAASLLLFMSVLVARAQSIENFGLSTSSGLRYEKVILDDSTVIGDDLSLPVFSFLLNGKYHLSSDVNASLAGTRFLMNFENSLRVTFASYGGGHPGWRGELRFQNNGFDTIEIRNVLPLGEDKESVYITGKGPWNLARAFLHRPGYDSIRVILPDNAWEMGLSIKRLGSDKSVVSMARRGENKGAEVHRYRTLLPPGSEVSFNLFSEVFTGTWQDGLKLMFRDRYIYDLPEFDNKLFEREDLGWIRKCYLAVMQFAWDQSFYDRFKSTYTFGSQLKEWRSRFGHLDVYGIWPTWPRLGLDKRNQWDLYDDLPGGTEQLRNFAEVARQEGTKFFIAYNPWDKSTRQEDPYAGMSRLIRETEADGVVLDTRGSSSVEIQEAADSVRDGVVMYSEGMAVVEDMPGIVSGRVHNAIFKSPELNLNKIIKPEFAIFRVCDVGEAILHREIAIAFFNGYGTELNLYRPGRYHNIENDYKYLARTTMLLRQNNDAFLDRDWVPLTQDSKKKLHINKWTAGDKTIYTVLNMDHKGFNGPAITVDTDKGQHYVSLWHHNELKVINNNGRKQVAVNAGSYPEKYTGTRKEASIDCIAAFPIILESRISNDTLYIYSDKPGDLKVWNCNPAYSKSPYETEINDSVAIDITGVFPDYEGKIVIQLFRDKLLADERIVEFRGGRPWLISEREKTPAHTGRIPGNMVLVPAARISYKPSSNDDFIPYPTRDGKMVEIDSFLIDRYPVTNEDYYRFILESGYSPRDTVNYLKHWDNGIYQQGKEKYPVVNISLEDARAYASWAGKRLPTELEWQLAAQGTDGRSWPWGNEFHGTKCNNSFDRSTPVDAFRKGQSPWGAMDMVGNVWQLTGDVYDNGSHYFVIIRGGSYYKPESSWWYIQGGPQPLDKTQMLLLVSPGFDRSSTVGFRCVKDL